MTLSFRPYSDFLIIVGFKGYGKTHLTKFYCKQLKRILVIDPKWQLGELGYVVHYPNRIIPAFSKFSKVVYQPQNVDDESYRATFQAALKFTNYTLVIDEIEYFAEPKRYLCPEVKTIIMNGRHQGIGLICNCRAPRDMHKDIRRSADHVICFFMHEEDDLDYMATWMKTTKDKIRNLKKYWSLYYNTTTTELVMQEPL